eukprot:NODE_16_length_49026_cov_1.035992.p9 type:complete len:375 gc:universal NODE_16_length_49026_cov_1.035992:35930-34806(-)
MEDTRSFEESRKKKRNRATPEQVAVLESFFYTTPCPNSKQREELATQIHMPERSVQIWFQNRRAKLRNMQKQSQANMNVSGRVPIPRWRRNSTPYGMAAPVQPNMLQQMIYYKSMQQSRDILLHVDTLVVGSQLIKQYHVWFNQMEPKLWIQMNTGDAKILIHIPFPVQMEWMDDLEGLQQSPCSGIRLQTQNFQVTLEDLTPYDHPVMDEHGITMVGGPALQQQFMQMQSNGRRGSTMSVNSGLSGLSDLTDRRMSLPYQQLNDLMVTPPMQPVAQPQMPHSPEMFSPGARSRAMSAPAHQIQNHLQHMYTNDYKMMSPGSSPNTYNGQIHPPAPPVHEQMHLPEKSSEERLAPVFTNITPAGSEPDFLSNIV